MALSTATLAFFVTMMVYNHNLDENILEMLMNLYFIYKEPLIMILTIVVWSSIRGQLLDYNVEMTLQYDI